MKNKRRSGFTMVEMLVVFMIMSVMIGAGVPPIQAYYRNAGYQDVQNRAETVFYAAQQTVTSMALSAQIEPYFQRIVTNVNALCVDHILFPYLQIVDDSAQRSRYYVIRFQKNELSSPTLEGQLVLDLLKNLMMDKDIFNASIAIEIDVYTYTIQTVFYSSEDNTFTYGTIPLKDRSEDALKQLNLGMAEANISVKVLALETNVLQEPFYATVDKPSYSISGVTGGDDEGTDENWWEDDPVGEDDPAGDGGDPWVIIDPTISSTNPFSIYIKFSKLTDVKNLRIHWMSTIDGKPITYTYKIWYYHRNNGKWMGNNGNNQGNKAYVATGDVNIKVNNWTTELRIDILSNGNTGSKYGIFEFTVYAQEKGVKFIAPIEVSETTNH